MGGLTWKTVICLVISWFPVSLHGATVTWCQQNPGCLCIDWDKPGGSHLEIRCPSSSSWRTGNAVAIGSFGGSGKADPTATGPSTLTPTQNFAVTSARNQAVSWLVDLQGGGRTDCEALFGGSPLLKNSWVNHPVMLLSEYIIFANGEGVRDSTGSKPCSGAVDAWTLCCGHSRIVFICNSFTDLGPRDRARRLIHEALHVAGQREENTDFTAGPNDPPHTQQIDQVVRAACG